MRVARGWLWLAALPIGAGFVLQALRQVGVVGRGETATPLFMAAFIMLLGAGFGFLQARRARREFAGMRRGEHLARWTYPSAEFGLAREQSWDDIDRRLQAMFWIPTVAIGLPAFGLSVVGAFAKSNPLLVLTLGVPGVLLGIAAGAMVWAVARLMMGARRDLVRQLDPELIFSRSGIYVPGTFIPIMDFPPGQRQMRMVRNESGIGRHWLIVRLVQGAVASGGWPHTNTTEFRFLVPHGREQEAQVLVGYYSG
jgi:hypothetical protein